MIELILIKTNESQKVKTLLERENITYETYQEEKPKKISEVELEQAYREAYADPERLKLTKEWEKVALKDLSKKGKNEWKDI